MHYIMAISSDSINLDQLIEGVKQILQKSPALSAPQHTSPTPPTATEYQAPLKGTWYNLGGFSDSQVRYDGRVGHKGLDMASSAGTPVYPMAAGVVTTTGTDNLGGNIIWIDHGNGIKSYYAHLSTIKVHKGDHVNHDSVIGTVGNTGNAGNPNDPLKTQESGRTWPHVHFGVKDHGVWVDPTRFFSAPKYDPNFAKNPKKYLNFWASDEAKQEAQTFNIKDHVKTKRVAFAQQVDQILKLAHEFSKLACG